MNSSAPELSGVQHVPLHRAPDVLLSALNNQSDFGAGARHRVGRCLFELALSRHRRGDQPGSTKLMPIFSSSSFTGPLTSGSTVVAGLAPAGAFALTVNGKAAPRTTFDTWTPFYQVAATSTPPTGHHRVAPVPLQWTHRTVHPGLVGDCLARLWLDSSTRVALYRATPSCQGAGARRGDDRCLEPAVSHCS